MKTVMMTLTAIAMIVTSAQAAERRLPKRQIQWGSQCGLTDEYGSDQWKEIGKGYNLSGRANEDETQNLPTVIKQQLIITANRGLDVEHTDPVRSSKEAIAYLREASEGGDLYVSHFEYNGNEFTQVLLYAGGNPNGLIFAKGTTHAVGIISDSDVQCIVK